MTSSIVTLTRLAKGEKQHPTEEANYSRFVTKLKLKVVSWGISRKDEEVEVLRRCHRQLILKSASWTKYCLRPWMLFRPPLVSISDTNVKCTIKCKTLLSLRERVAVLVQSDSLRWPFGGTGFVGPFGRIPNFLNVRYIWNKHNVQCRASQWQQGIKKWNSFRGALWEPGGLSREYVLRIPSPSEHAGGLSREICPPYPPACRKRRVNGAVCRNHRVVPCRCRTGTLKNPAKCLWRWEPDRRYNFCNPPAHLCRHIYDWNIVACDVKHQ